MTTITTEMSMIVVTIVAWLFNVTSILSFSFPLISACSPASIPRWPSPRRYGVDWKSRPRRKSNLLFAADGRVWTSLPLGFSGAACKNTAYLRDEEVCTMRVGISTACLFPMLTEQALKTLLEEGVKTVEIFLNSPREAGSDFAALFHDLADAAGAKVWAFTRIPPNTKASGFSAVMSAVLRIWWKNTSACSNCAILWARTSLLFTAQETSTGFRPNFMPNASAAFAKLPARFGVRVCHENVVCFACGDLSYLRLCSRLRRTSTLA
jgi:hypothetical protein